MVAMAMATVPVLAFSALSVLSFASDDLDTLDMLDKVHSMCIRCAFDVHSMCIRYVDMHSTRNIMDSMDVREFQTM